MSGPSNKPQDEFVYPLSSGDVPKIMEERGKWVTEAGHTVKEIRELELESDLRLVDPVWQRRYENALRRFEWQRELIHGLDWALEVALRGRAEQSQAAQVERQTKIAESQAKSADAQTLLSRSIKRATWVMTAAIFVQAIIAACMWLWPRSGH